MKRKEFFKKGIIGLGAIVSLPSVLTSCKSCTNDQDETVLGGACQVSPTETKGPFPIKTPSQLVQANITSDRTGVALLVNITVQNKNCQPVAGVLVDIWHCDKEGNYSEYGGTSMQVTDYTNVHFLRGRQATDANGRVSFITIYPGWYSSRAPHIHVEVLSSSGGSLLVTQIAFPENISSTVYASSLYASHGQADTANTSDNLKTWEKIILFVLCVQ
jgi:protocatechuate 3,4-dioxygenase beta subunit